MKADKLFELHKQKIELYEDISKLDLESAKKKDEYRKITLEIVRLEGNYINREVN